jgi:hypothetical protein
LYYSRIHIFFSSNIILFIWAIFSKKLAFVNLLKSTTTSDFCLCTHDGGSGPALSLAIAPPFGYPLTDPITLRKGGSIPFAKGLSLYLNQMDRMKRP